MRRLCECETVPAGRPDPRDSYQEAEVRLPHPHCPVHAEADAENGVDFSEFAPEYDLAWNEETGEWVDADLIDPDTGYPYENEETEK